MSPQFQIEINFSIIAKESEEFFIQHQRVTTLFSLNVSTLTIWLLTFIKCLLGARCYVGFECIALLFTITCEVEVFVSFHHLWYRKGDFHTQHHAAKECKKQDLKHLRVQSMNFLIRCSVRHGKTPDMHWMALNSFLSICISPISPSPRILRWKLKNNFFFNSKEFSHHSQDKRSWALETCKINRVNLNMVFWAFYVTWHFPCYLTSFLFFLPGEKINVFLKEPDQTGEPQVETFCLLS